MASKNIAQDPVSTDEEKERRRKKQYKRMGKILGRAWELDDPTNHFQDRPSDLPPSGETSDGYVLCLTDIGRKIDDAAYRLGRHGWEDFSRDLGGVYNLHISSSRRRATAPLARKHLDVVNDLLGSIDKSLADLAKEHTPEEPSSNVSGKKKLAGTNGNNATTEAENRKLNKKRKITDNNNRSSNLTNDKSKKSKHSNKNRELAEREEKAMDQLTAFVEEHGGSPNILSGFRSRVTRQRSKGKFDILYYNEAGRRFRSMMEVGRFLKLVTATTTGGGGARAGIRFRKPSSKEQEAEKKRIRKELERLRKAYQKATKCLDDFATASGESRYPIDDLMLLEEERESNAKATNGNTATTTYDDSSDKKQPQQGVSPITSAVACIPDSDGFDGIPKHCTPDVLMTWDFFCTFERALSLSPISLNDFADSLVYVPPEGQSGDDVLAPPVYLAETHLSLLKLLLQDRSSDDWWWSTLESDESEKQATESGFDETEDAEKEDDGKPVIKIDMASALETNEDPLITTSWMRALENGKDDVKDGKAVKMSIKAALKIVSNKWVAAYLKKTLELHKSQGMEVAKRAVTWLYNNVLEARPDLGDRVVHKTTVSKAKAKVLEEISKQMETLADTIPTVTDEEVVSDFDYEDDSDDESDDDDDSVTPEKPAVESVDNQDESQKPASTVPPKPLPSLVDLLLPPAKPKYNSDFVDAFTWPHVVGATVARFLHRKKRILNEIDNSIRDVNAIRPLNVSERRERESVIASRILTECGDSNEVPAPLERATEHLCSGGNYLDLSAVERLCILRLLIEAAYDSGRVYEVVSGNHKMRTNALKSLDLEQKRAKKEAKEKAAADEAAAREQLAAEARDKFIDEKREEIRKLNERSKEFSDDIIESLTEEDIIEFDDDIRADFEALPGPETFNKSEVAAMIRKMQEQTAFDTDALLVLTMDELIQREKGELEDLKGQLSDLGGENALRDPSLDRDTAKSIERLQRDIEKALNQTEKLPALREKALEQLTDAIENGTVKVLRAAFTAAKKAKLCGIDDETGGVWAVDVMRDAALELENAKQNKRLLDTQKDLVAKLNKCFIRTEPVGHNRFGNRYWAFDNGEAGQTWVEAEFAVKHSQNDSSNKPEPGFLDLSMAPEDMAVGSNDMEEDLIRIDERRAPDSFLQFSRREYHSSGEFPSLVKHSWGCHTTEDSLRALIKNLDSRGIRENGLKTHLKESLEQAVGSSDKHETNEPATADDEEQAQEHDDGETKEVIKYSGDEAAFAEVKESDDSKDDFVHDIRDSKLSAIGEFVRVRKILEESKNVQIARYENGTVTGWKIVQEKVEDAIDDVDDEDFVASQSTQRIIDVPLWRLHTERGHVEWLYGSDLLQSMARYKKWKQRHGYFESDASFLAYRNSLGRYTGKASEASYASSPYFFAKLMLKRESELYPKLKTRSYDNSWGGQSGARALWTNSMKDYAYDFPTVRQGLLTLENAFFELTGKFTEYKDVNDDVSIDGTALLNDPSRRFDIELESIEKNLAGLWNSPSSRAVYIAIVNDCKTTGFLALALDLLVRNTMQYLHAHKLLNARSSRSVAAETITSNYAETTARPVRSTRRMNAWQQQQLSFQEDDDDNDNDNDGSDEDWY